MERRVNNLENDLKEIKNLIMEFTSNKEKITDLIKKIEKIEKILYKYKEKTEIQENKICHIDKSVNNMQGTNKTVAIAVFIEVVVLFLNLIVRKV